jgi:hypothetical protein
MEARLSSLLSLVLLSLLSLSLIKCRLLDVHSGGISKGGR